MKKWDWIIILIAAIAIIMAVEMLNWATPSGIDDELMSWALK